uniref:Uncharacterized protein n=1 Tax=Acrobeloides nanus TaxID=290746 RepID=A0A914BYN8_9BILA
MSQNLVESKPPDEHTTTQNKRDSNDLDPPKLFQKHHAELKTPKRLMIPNHENSAPVSPFNRLRRLSKAEFPGFRKVGLKRMKPVGHLDYNQIVHRFERQSTFHGICHAATAPDKKSRHFWHLAFAVCLALLLLQIFWVFQRYRQYAKTVDLDLKFENAPFPSVTLCNLNPYKASAISSDAATKKTMEAFMNIMKSGGRTEGVAASIAHLGNKTLPAFLFMTVA